MITGIPGVNETIQVNESIKANKHKDSIISGISISENSLPISNKIVPIDN